jgi:hypothetical protein
VAEVEAAAAAQAGELATTAARVQELEKAVTKLEENLMLAREATTVIQAQNLAAAEALARVAAAEARAKKDVSDTKHYHALLEASQREVERVNEFVKLDEEEVGECFQESRSEVRSETKSIGSIDGYDGDDDDEFEEEEFVASDDGYDYESEWEARSRKEYKSKLGEEGWRAREEAYARERKAAEKKWAAKFEEESERRKEAEEKAEELQKRLENMPDPASILNGLVEKRPGTLVIGPRGFNMVEASSRRNTGGRSGK